MPSEHLPRVNYLLVFTIVVCIILVNLDRTGQFPALRTLTTTLYGWMILLSAAALLLGVANVLKIHVQRIVTGQSEWHLSLALVSTLAAVFVAASIDPAGVASPVVEWIFDSIIAPIQSALFALLIFFMVAAAYRFLRLDRPGGLWVLLGVLIVLAVQTPLLHGLLPPFAGTAVNWLVDYPVMAALRGALLGSSLALLVVAMRFLLSRH